MVLSVCLQNDYLSFLWLITYIKKLMIEYDKKPMPALIGMVRSHAQTNMWLLKQFFDVDFKLEKFGNATIVTVN